jgi:hypothetical protein
MIPHIAALMRATLACAHARETAGAARTRSSLRPYRARASVISWARIAPRECRCIFGVIVRESGRSSIPETAVIESIIRGVLDAPLSRSMTVLRAATIRIASGIRGRK